MHVWIFTATEGFFQGDYCGKRGIILYELMNEWFLKQIMILLKLHRVYQLINSSRSCTDVFVWENT